MTSFVSEQKEEPKKETLVSKFGLPPPHFKKYKSPAEQGLDKKLKSIKEGQEVKTNSITMASASRDASLMLSVLIPFLYKDLTEEQLKTKWSEWRKWFLERLQDRIQDFAEPF